MNSPDRNSVLMYAVPVFLIYFITSLLAFRFNFGSNGLPAGTNSLGTYADVLYTKKHLLDTWFSMTDWGQSLPGFTGPTVLYPFALLLNPTVFVRVTEFVAFLSAGLSMYLVALKVIRSQIAAFTSGFYYLLTAQTGQFFEGHLGLLIVFAFLPVFYYFIHLSIRKPGFTSLTVLAVILYAMASLGDLGGVYFALVVAVPVAVYLFIKRFNEVGFYSRREFMFILYGSLLFTGLMFTWLLPYLQGMKPEYTTSITSTFISFRNASGISPVYSIVGFVGDNSYILFGFHRVTYSIFQGSLWYLSSVYYVIPVILAVYVIIKRRMIVSLIFAASILAVVVSSANTIPGLWYFNYFLYEYVPLFNTVPALFRWTIFTVLGYSFIIAFLVRDLAAALRPGSGIWENMNSVSGLRKIILKAGRKKIVVIAVIAILTVIPVLQNFDVFTGSPQDFTFPSSYTSAYSYLNNSTYGNVMTIPFGVVYERPPWTGVSQSSSFMSPVYSGKNVVLFEAGTPYSRNMDYFIGNGMYNGFTDNITKYLESANVRYIVTTKYQNWSYASGIVYPANRSYSTFTNQTGLGNSIYQSNLQTVYELQNAASNVSFSPTYYVYYGNSSLLYEILNQPWYLGSSTPLINGSSIVTSQTQVLEHASGIIVSPNTLRDIPETMLMKSREKGVPLMILYDYMNIKGTRYDQYISNWSASNAVSFSCINLSTPVSFQPGLSYLYSAGYTNLSFQIRAQIGNGGNLVFTYGNNSWPVIPGGNILRFQNLQVGNTSLLKSGNPGIKGNNISRIDTLTLTAFKGNEQKINPSVETSYIPEMANSTSSFSFNSSSWGVIVLAQTYNTLWSMKGEFGSAGHVLAEIGLNGWVVNGTSGLKGHIVFEGNNLLHQAIDIEFIFVPSVLILGVAISFWFRKGKE